MAQNIDIASMKESTFQTYYPVITRILILACFFCVSTCATIQEHVRTEKIPIENSTVKEAKEGSWEVKISAEFRDDKTLVFSLWRVRSCWTEVTQTLHKKRITERKMSIEDWGWELYILAGFYSLGIIPLVDAFRAIDSTEELEPEKATERIDMHEWGREPTDAAVKISWGNIERSGKIQGGTGTLNFDEMVSALMKTREQRKPGERFALLKNISTLVVSSGGQEITVEIPSKILGSFSSLREADRENALREVDSFEEAGNIALGHIPDFGSCFSNSINFWMGNIKATMPLCLCVGVIQATSPLPQYRKSYGTILFEPHPRIKESLPGIGTMVGIIVNPKVQIYEGRFLLIAKPTGLTEKYTTVLGAERTVPAFLIYSPQPLPPYY